MRIETVDELKHHLKIVFDDPSLQFDDDLGYGVTFGVPGKARDVMLSLQDRTDATRWGGEAGNLFYKCDDQNWLLYLRSIPHAVVCIALVRSLHRRHLEQYQGMGSQA